MNNEIENIKRLLESGQQDNIEVALTNEYFNTLFVNEFNMNVEQYLKNEYQELIDFVSVNKHNHLILTNKSLVGQIMFIHELTELHFFTRNINKIPKNIKYLKNLQTLSLMSSDCDINLLIDYIAKAKIKLKMLLLTGLEISVLSDAIGEIESLEYLHLTANFIKKIPNSILCLPNLKHLAINNNILQYIDVMDLLNLETLNIKGNPTLKTIVALKDSKLTEENITKDLKCNILWR